MSNQPVQVGVSWALNVQIPAADVVKCFVVVHDCHICVFQQRVHAQHLQAIILRNRNENACCTKKMFCLKTFVLQKLVFGSVTKFAKITTYQQKSTTFWPRGSIVRLDNCCGYLWATPDREGNLALFPIVHGQAFQHEAPQARSGATAASVVHTETLQSSTAYSNGHARCGC